MARFIARPTGYKFDCTKRDIVRAYGNSEELNSFCKKNSEKANEFLAISKIELGVDDTGVMYLFVDTKRIERPLMHPLILFVEKLIQYHMPGNMVKYWPTYEGAALSAPRLSDDDRWPTGGHGREPTQFVAPI